jgi:hypothetical protein
MVNSKVDVNTAAGAGEVRMFLVTNGRGSIKTNGSELQILSRDGLDVTSRNSTL